MANRLALYVDGFNFYHAVSNLKRPHLKWVDLFRLAQQLAREHETVVAVRYFSAFATWLPRPYARHRQFVKALQARGVDAVMAHFKKRTMHCHSCGASWVSREEKETDVHLALRLLADAEDDVFDRGMLLTADSDLVPALKMLKSRHPDKNITIAAPPKRYSQGRHLKQISDSYFSISPGKMERSLLPERVCDSDGVMVAERPRQYAPPD